VDGISANSCPLRYELAPRLATEVLRLANMSSKSDLMSHQRQWAESVGLAVDIRGYVGTVEDNLFQPLNESTKAAFETGSGSELQDTGSRPAKMKALHSSSALAVNFFDCWVGTEAAQLRKVLGLETGVLSIVFEEQCPTGLGGIPPNLDIALRLEDGHVVGIESKFSEWLPRHSKGYEPFKPKYFASESGLWAERGFPKAQVLAEQMRSKDIAFNHLNAAQLLKHALGLATRFGRDISLGYLYLDWPGPESELHSAEIDRFASLIDENMRFRVWTYNNLIKSLVSVSGVNERYTGYLVDRYIPTSHGR